MLPHLKQIPYPTTASSDNSRRQQNGNRKAANAATRGKWKPTSSGRKRNWKPFDTNTNNNNNNNNGDQETPGLSKTVVVVITVLELLTVIPR